MTEKKWTPERVHQEVYDARTKLFVITKVLESGNIKLAELPEWTLVIRPLLSEVVQYAEQIRSMTEEKPTAAEGEATK